MAGLAANASLWRDHRLYSRISLSTFRQRAKMAGRGEYQKRTIGEAEIYMKHRLRFHFFYLNRVLDTYKSLLLMPFCACMYEVGLPRDLCFYLVVYLVSCVPDHHLAFLRRFLHR